MRNGNIIFNNFWPKIISLFLAIATWFYVFDIITTDNFVQRKETAQEVLQRMDMIVKDVPVKAVFYGRSAKGYKVKTEEVIIDPAVLSIFGPREILEDIDVVRTDKINMGEYTRSARVKVGVHSNHNLLKLDDKVVDVYIPVEANGEDK